MKQKERKKNKNFDKLLLKKKYSFRDVPINSKFYLTDKDLEGKVDDTGIPLYEEHIANLWSQLTEKQEVSNQLETFERFLPQYHKEALQLAEVRMMEKDEKKLDEKLTIFFDFKTI